MNVNTFLDLAKSNTNLDDYGDDDFLIPLNILVNSLNTEAKLSDIGRYQAEQSIVTNLEYRLKIQQYVNDHPEVHQQKVERPIFIAGLPRTGTTALLHLLNQDPSNHTLRLWEGRHPLPPPEEATYNSDPRIDIIKQEVELTEEFMPGFSKAHLMEADEPDECYLLFNRNFVSVEYLALFHLPSYAKWLYTQDHTKAYAYHKLQLQILQSNKAGQWVLKSPFHQVGLKAILENYPDATIVQTHRPPVSIVGSGCSFSELLRKQCTTDLDLNIIGKDWMEMLSAYLDRFEVERNELEPQHPNQFVDIDYKDFISDPLTSIRSIYSSAGKELSDEAQAEMTQWLDSNPQGKHGKHVYSLENYGISKADVENLFADYVERYQLTME
jgi:hypothetical protein